MLIGEIQKGNFGISSVLIYYLDRMKLTLLLSYFFCCSVLVAQDILRGTATRVYDGDTFTLLTSDNKEIKIRVVGIDAPEAKQDYGLTARDYARNILDGKQVTVYLEPGETYGRLLGIVITEDGVHFNYDMVASGNAWWYDQYSKDKYLEAAFEKAKAEKKGLWSTNNPQAPWEWRKQN